MKTLLIAIAGIAVGAGAVGYVNYANNQSIEKQFASMNIEMAQLTVEIEKLTDIVNKQEDNKPRYRNTASIDPQIVSGIKRNKSYKGSANMTTNLALLEQEKIEAKEKARKKHVGKSMATN